MESTGVPGRIHISGFQIRSMKLGYLWTQNGTLASEWTILLELKV